MFAFFERVKVFVLKHKCLLGVLAVFFYLTWEMWFVKIVTPIRCKMWEGKEIEVFMTPEEWRKASGVNESLKNTKWISSGDLPEKTIDGIEYFLLSVNENNPNLGIYMHIEKKSMNRDIYLLYDRKINKSIVLFNNIVGLYYTPFFHRPIVVNCENRNAVDIVLQLENFL